MQPRERASLISIDTDDGETNPKFLWNNFILMSVMFAITNGCGITVVAFASAEFQSLGGYSNGVLSIAYGVSALHIAGLVTQTVGSRAALVWSLRLYCIYVFSFVYASAFKHTSVILFGAAIGGLAGRLARVEGAVGSHLQRKRTPAGGGLNADDPHAAVAQRRDHE